MCAHTHTHTRAHILTTGAFFLSLSTHSKARKYSLLRGYCFGTVLPIYMATVCTQTQLLCSVVMTRWYAIPPSPSSSYVASRGDPWAAHDWMTQLTTKREALLLGSLCKVSARSPQPLVCAQWKASLKTHTHTYVHVCTCTQQQQRYYGLTLSGFLWLQVV